MLIVYFLSQEIPGNTGEGIVKHYLDEPVLVRYVRFKILSFSGVHPCMRVEVFGCAPGKVVKNISLVKYLISLQTLLLFQF